MKDLWPLLLSAQENIAGIPSAFLEQKKEEIKQRQVMMKTWEVTNLHTDCDWVLFYILCCNNWLGHVYNMIVNYKLSV